MLTHSPDSTAIVQIDNLVNEQAHKNKVGMTEEERLLRKYCEEHGLDYYKEIAETKRLQALAARNLA